LDGGGDEYKTAVLTQLCPLRQNIHKPPPLRVCMRRLVQTYLGLFDGP
jgi:hypothetical protein